MAPKADEEVWTAEQLLGVKKNLRKRSVEVLIKWKGKPASKNNWEEVDMQNLDDEMLEPFEEAIRVLKKNKRTDLDEEVEDKEMGQDEYVVEDVLGIQWNPENRALEYYIKWEGWDNQFNNWEPESNCDCDDLIDPFSKAADHLKKTFGSKSRKRAGPKSRTTKPASDAESDDEPVVKKRPGPKSKTVVTKTRPGPKSRTQTPAKPEPTKRPGPKSRTSTPGPASSKRPGPKSRTAKMDSDDEDEKEEKKTSRKSNSESDDDGGAGDRNGDSSAYKKISDSDNESDRADSPPPKKKPGPKSRTSTAGPASSKKRPGPKSRTAAADSDDSD